MNFNPRSPWGERPSETGKEERPEEFQSTLPVGGATAASVGAGSARAPDFNPRSPWGERPSLRPWPVPPEPFQSTLPVGGATRRSRRSVHPRGISIHAPRGGSDTSMPGCPMPPRHFNPRSPWGERLPHVLLLLLQKIISIHAPRGGSDKISQIVVSILTIFQSTLPVGGATAPSWLTLCFMLFQSTLPVGGATIYMCQLTPTYNISIHAPRGGSDAVS